jgi:hypothetical protein
MFRHLRGRAVQEAIRSSDAIGAEEARDSCAKNDGRDLSFKLG